MLKSKKAGRVSPKERWSYGLYFVGQNLFYTLIALNIQTFFTDKGITAAATAVVLLVTKIWDTINDPLFGIIVDKLRFKKGRYMPWIRLSLPLIALTALFLFAMPGGENISPAIKIAWAIVGYALWDMAYTICDVPIFALPSTMTDDVSERTSVLSFGRLMASLGAGAAGLPLAFLQARAGWSAVGILYTFLGVVTMLPLCFAGKERYIARPEKDVTLREMARCLTGNKFLWIFFGALLVGSITTTFPQVMSLYFARYNLGSQDLAGVLGIVGIVPGLLGTFAVPLLVKRFDKYYLMMASILGGLVLYFVRFFVGYGSFTVYAALFAVQTFFMSGYVMLMFMFTPDCVEYGIYHTGEWSSGVAFAVQTFFAKLSSTVSASVGMFILALMGFQAGENAVQPPSAMNGIWLCTTLLPAIGLVIAAAILYFYRLRDKDVQVMVRYNSGEITKEEADSHLAEKFGPAAVMDNMEIIRSED